MAIDRVRSGSRAEAAAAAAAAAGMLLRRRLRRCRRRRRHLPPAVQKITLASKALFDFDKAVLKPEGKAAIDSEIIAEAVATCRSSSSCSSPATPTGSARRQYNQKLSERRADAVRDYLRQQGRRRGTRSRPSAWARRSRFLA